MYDELKAANEIKGLSEAARSHLKHITRNSLQGILGDIETNELEGAKEEVLTLSERLTRLRL